MTKQKLLELHEELSHAKNLEPSTKINAVFSELVEIVQNTPPGQSKEILEDEEIQTIKNSIRRMASEAESKLELFWTENALKSSDIEQTLRSFPYYSNYKEMTDLEIETMKSCDVDFARKVLFVGSGPLPLSSIMMARTYGISIDNLDSDENACKHSKKILERLGLSHKIDTIRGNVFEINNFSAYQIIFIAALVGENEDEKKKIIDHVVSRSLKNTTIMMRSVSDLGVLLYPEVVLTSSKEIDLIQARETPKDIINTILVGKTAISPVLLSKPLSFLSTRLRDREAVY